MFDKIFWETASYFFSLVIKLMLLFVVITFVVGLILQYIKPGQVKSILNKTHRSVGNIVGAGLGAITPFCSCSTIPVLVGLLQSGVPFGASISFLIASPVLNPIIIGLLLGLFGWKMTLMYSVITFVAAVMAGIIWENLGLANQIKKVKIVGKCVKSHDLKTESQGKISGTFQEAMKLFRKVLPFIVIGAAIGSIIRGYVPGDFIMRISGTDNPLAIPVASVVGIPLYIRAASMVPISSVLLEKGMGIGVVVALIIGGAGASIPEVAILGSIFKYKLIIAFVLTVLTIATMAGFLFAGLSDWLQ